MAFTCQLIKQAGGGSPQKSHIAMSQLNEAKIMLLWIPNMGFIEAFLNIFYENSFFANW
jgi:hypothetical protein